MLDDSLHHHSHRLDYREMTRIGAVAPRQRPLDDSQGRNRNRQHPLDDSQGRHRKRNLLRDVCQLVQLPSRAQ